MSDVILILGAGNAQIDAIEYCKGCGYEVVGCSYTTVDNGIPYLDYFEHVDIKSVEGIKEIACKYKVKAIYSVGSDVAMPTVMKASEELGLPHFIEPSVAETCQSKSKMRGFLGPDFEGNTKYLECTSLEQAVTFRAFPGMMKPTDSQGQRGCFKVECEKDIRKEFQTSMNFSHEGKVIIEEYLDGPEASVNAFFKDGRMEFAVVSDRISFDEYPGGIIKEHLLPSRLSENTQQRIKSISCEAAQKLGVTNGPCYFQIKLNSDGDPKILEVTPRLDGCHMWNVIKNYCGVDLLDVSFRYLIGEDVSLTCNEPEKGAVYRLKFFCQPPWTKFERASYDDTDALYSFFYYEDGDKVRRLNGYIEKCGYAIYKDQ